MKRLALALLALAILAAPGRGQNPLSASFPSTAATDGTLFVAHNSSHDYLHTTINDSTTTVVLDDASSFTAPAVIVMDNEILHCATLTTNTFTTCAREQETSSGGGAKAAHTAGVDVWGYSSADMANQDKAEIKAIETYLLTATSNTAAFTSQTSIAITHNLGTVNVLVECKSAASPPVRVYPSTVTYTSTSVVTVAFASSQSGSCTVISGGNAGGPVPGVENTVSYTSSPNFDLSAGWLQKITLTGNATATVSNPQSGITYTFLVCQDGTGGRTFAWPSGFHGAMTIGSTLSTCSLQSFMYDGGATLYYATGAGVINQ
jgi:hypothetical protein